MRATYLENASRAAARKSTFISDLCFFFPLLYNRPSTIVDLSPSRNIAFFALVYAHSHAMYASLHHTTTLDLINSSLFPVTTPQIYATQVPVTKKNNPINKVMLIFLFLSPPPPSLEPLSTLVDDLTLPQPLLPRPLQVSYVHVPEAAGEECAGNNDRAGSKDDVDDNYIVVQIVVAILDDTSD